MSDYQTLQSKHFGIEYQRGNDHHKFTTKLIQSIVSRETPRCQITMIHRHLRDESQQGYWGMDYPLNRDLDTIEKMLEYQEDPNLISGFMHVRVEPKIASITNAAMIINEAGRIIEPDFPPYQQLGMDARIGQISLAATEVFARYQLASQEIAQMMSNQAYNLAVKPLFFTRRN